MNILTSLKNSANRLHIKNQISAFDIIDLVNKEGIIMYREKYGFIKFINGYNIQTEMFNYIEAPLSYAFNVWSSIFHVNALGFQTEYQKSFDEIEYFSWEIKPLSKLQKWVLLKVYKVSILK